MSVLEITSLEGVDLSLQVGKIVRDLRAPPHQLGQLLPGVDVGDALLGVARHDDKKCEVAVIFLNKKKRLFWITNKYFGFGIDCIVELFENKINYSKILEKK